MINKYILFLVAGTNKLKGFINQKSNSHVKYIFNRPVENHGNFQPTIDLIRMLSSISRYTDWICLILILIGLGIVVSSYYGNNGKWRNSGYRMIWSGYATVIIIHTIIIAGPSVGNLGNMKLLIFFFMLLGQLLFYVATSSLYLIGSQQLEIYEMSNQPSNERNATSMYNFMMVTMIAGAVAYMIAGLF